MPNHKHLTFDDRSYIHASLNAGHSFRYIANHLDKDPSTISKEVRHHRIRLTSGAYGRIFNVVVNKKSAKKAEKIEQLENDTKNSGRKNLSSFGQHLLSIHSGYTNRLTDEPRVASLYS